MSVESLKTFVTCESAEPLRNTVGLMPRHVGISILLLNGIEESASIGRVLAISKAAVKMRFP